MKKLFIHGGYYDFTNCSFQKWTLDSREPSWRKMTEWLPKIKYFGVDEFLLLLFLVMCRVAFKTFSRTSKA